MWLLRERKQLQGELITFAKGFSWQTYWSGLPLLTSGDLPDSEIKPVYLMSSALADSFFITSTNWEAPYHNTPYYCHFAYEETCWAKR